MKKYCRITTIRYAAYLGINLIAAICQVAVALIIITKSRSLSWMKVLLRLIRKVLRRWKQNC